MCKRENSLGNRPLHRSSPICMRRAGRAAIEIAECSESAADNVGVWLRDFCDGGEMSASRRWSTYLKWSSSSPMEQ